MILKKDFVVHKYCGFITDHETPDEYRPIQIAARDKFISRVMRTQNLTIMNNEFKEIFMPFVVKHLNTSAYNIMVIPIFDEILDQIG